ncbi:TIGR04104 family putative zinc finger protein [Bacillus spongiae]|uniref:TIGR04104 family putative zinc finger protein n=1 Tax=Bacillus spongiae TaxID=2683610 RepID=UPI003AF50379
MGFALQKCENCNRQFSWGKIYNSVWSSYKPIECDNCNKEHSITTSGKVIALSLTILPLLIFAFVLSPFSNSFLNISAGLIVLFIGSLFTPYLVKYEWKK